jgi:SAM-dependent methyltransferase
VLDLGAGSGSFAVKRSDLSIVRLDLEVPAARGVGAWVSADAARLPFRSRSFDAVISNHSLEHFIELGATLAEVGRVIRPEGALYIAVPDAGTLADRIYRWLGRGGGHVNPFYSPREVSEMVERITGLRHRRTHPLYTSLSFLNANNFRARPPRKIALFAFGNERFLAILVWLLRRIDLRFGTRLSHYGWAFYFGEVDPSEQENWINVCVRCGSGHSLEFLKQRGAVRGWYSCPACRARNLLVR